MPKPRVSRKLIPQVQVDRIPAADEGDRAQAPGFIYGPRRTVDFLERVTAVAAQCGVTRLADITGLDRLGMPVWQAVRPAGHALSIHQGKGATAVGARIGALCEAIESHRAERVPADGPLCPFASLPKSGPAVLSDYSRERSLPRRSNEPIQWCSAMDYLTGSEAYLPHDLVSLDFRTKGRTYFDRSSNGLGVGANEQDAAQISLLELVERDAVGDWRRRNGTERQKRELDPGTIPFGWFGFWHDRLRSLDIRLRVFRLRAVVQIPVLACWITGREEFGTAQRSFAGTAAHPDPEVALFKALAEAIQSRLTHIAGSRDDILPSAYTAIEAQRPLAVPPASPDSARRWGDVESRPANADRIAEDLARAGYPHVAIKRLDLGGDGIAVTKAFVAGLGSLTRRRRRPRCG